jgi:hypothetical protein
MYLDIEAAQVTMEANPHSLHASEHDEGAAPAARSRESRRSARSCWPRLRVGCAERATRPT